MGYTHGFKWNDDLVKEKILEVKQSLCLDRMPTRSEIEKVMQNNGLTDRISRTKGYYGWAKELGLDIKNSETSLGKKYENIIKEKLERKGYHVEKMSQNYHFDLLVNDNVRIDIKVGRLYTNTDGVKWHTFNLYKKHSSCDIYYIVCLDNEDNIIKELIIPSFKCKIKQLSLGAKSMYDSYIDRYDILDKYINFYNNF